MLVSTNMGILVFRAAIVFCAFVNVNADFPLPFEINTNNGEGMNGESKIRNKDDELTTVTFTKDFLFGDEKFTKFYISPDGAVLTTKPNPLPPTSTDVPWKKVLPHTIAFFHQDATLNGAGCDTDRLGCGVYWRKGDAITSSIITNITRSAHLLNPNMDVFTPDPELTLIVTWWRVMKTTNVKRNNIWTPDPSLRNTFQGVLTSDGNRSYAIYSYLNLTNPVGPKGYKAGVFFKGDGTPYNNNQDEATSHGKWCQLPAGKPKRVPDEKKEQLLCQSNVYNEGVFIIGLTAQSHPTCNSLKDFSQDTTANHYVDATCARCQDTNINTNANGCTKPPKKVCGSNDKTYDNFCDLKQDACRRFDGSLTLFEDRACYRSPCLTNNGGCEDKCRVSAADKYQAECSCSEGKMLKKDGRTCDWTGYAYFGTHNTFYLGKGFHRMSNATVNGTILALTHDFNNNSIFYATYDYMHNVTVIVRYSPKKPEPIYKRVRVVSGNLTAMRFDSVESKLIVGNMEGHVMEITDVYSEIPGLEMVSTFGSVADLLIEPCERKYFVADSEAGKIYLFNKTTRYDVVVKGLKSVRTIAADRMKNKLYWYSESKGIEEASYDGTCRRTVLSMRDLQNNVPTSMFFENGSLYWLGAGDDSNYKVIMMRMESNSSMNVKMQMQMPLRGFGMLMPDNHGTCPLKFSCSDPCGVKNGGCEDMCRSHADKNGKMIATCHCRGSKTLKRDGMNCDFNGYLFVGGEDQISFGNYPMDRSGGGRTSETELMAQGNVTTMVFDRMSNKMIFATQNGSDFAIKMRDVKNEKVTILHRGYSKVVGMVWDRNDSSVIFALQNGTISNLKDIYSQQTSVEHVNTFDSIVAIEEESCSGEIFVLEVDNRGSGKILSHGGEKGKRTVIEEDIMNPTAMTLDRKHHYIYWASDNGIEEAKYDGSCRRKVRNSSSDSVSDMVYTADLLYSIASDRMQDGSTLHRINISDGSAMSVLESLSSRLFSVGVVTPKADWEKPVKYIDDEAMMNKVPKIMVSRKMDDKYQKYHKEVKIEFMFKATSWNRTGQRTIIQFGFSGISGFMPGAYYSQHNLVVVFFNGLNFTVTGINTNQWHSVQMGLQREGNYYRHFLYVDGMRRHSFTQNLDEVPGMNNFYIQSDPDKGLVQEGYIKMLYFYRKVRSATCPISKACKVHCPANRDNSVCEDKCMEGFGSADRCQCGGGKQKLKPDKVTCDWNYYSYSGGDYYAFLVNGTGSKQHTVLMPAKGLVSSMDHDYQHNLLFYSVSYKNRDGSYKHSIISHHPYKKSRTLATSLPGMAEHLNFHLVTQSLSYSIGRKIYVIDDVHKSTGATPRMVYECEDCNEITGMVLKPCTDKREYFYANGRNISYFKQGQPFANKTDIYMGNAYELAVDRQHKKLLWNSDTSIHESGYDGQCIREITKIEKGKPYDMYMAGEYLIWSNMLKVDMKTNMTYMANDTRGNWTYAMLNTNTGRTTYNASTHRIYGMGIIYDRKQYNQWFCDVKPQCFSNCSTAGCHGTCRIQAGRARCSCPYGKLNEDQRSCNFTDYVIYSSQQTIHGISKTMADFKFHVGGHIYALDYDYQKQMIIYAAQYENVSKINMFDMMNNMSYDKHRTVVTQPLNMTVRHISYDEKNQDIYFGSTNELCVSRMIFNDSKAMIVYKFGNRSEISGLVFEPCGRRVFITHRSHGMGNLSVWDNNTGLQTLMSGLNNPRALAIDRTVKRLYFFEGDNIMEVTYDGKCTRQVTRIREVNSVYGWMNMKVDPFGLVVRNSKNQMWWTDMEEVRGKDLEISDYMKYMNGSYGNSSFEVSYTLLTTAMDKGLTKIYQNSSTKVYDLEVIRDRSLGAASCAKHDVCSQCSHNNGGCEDRCIPTHGAFDAKCGCAHGELSSDGKKCNFTGYGIYASQYFVTLSKDHTKDPVFIFFNGTALGVESDYDKNIIFYSTTGYEYGKMVYKIQGFDVKGVVKTYYQGDQKIERLAFDRHTKDMYYTTHRHLMVVRDIYNNNVTTHLATFMGTAGLVFEPCKRMVFVLCTGSNALYAWDVAQGRLKTILQNLKNPRALGVDLVLQKLYFFENDRIAQSSYDGKCVNTIVKLEDNHDIKPYQISYGGDHLLYYTDTTKRADGYRMSMINTLNRTITVSHRSKDIMYGMYFIWDRMNVTNQFYCAYAAGKSCVKGACRKNNGGCQDVCVAEDDYSKIRCVCSHGMLRPDLKTCEFTDYFVTGMDKTVLMFGRTNLPVRTGLSGSVQAVEGYYDKNTIFYSVKMGHHPNYYPVIRSFTFKKDKHKDILRGKEGTEIKYLAFDAGEQKLYYATETDVHCFDMATSESMRIDDSIRHVASGRIHGLVFNPCERQIFVSRDGGLRSSKMNGKWSVVSAGRHQALSIDIVANKLYYYSGYNLMQKNYDGSCEKKITTASNEYDTPSASVVRNQENAVYWLQRNIRDRTYVLMKTNVRTGEITEVKKDRNEMEGLLYLQDRNLLAYCPSLNTKDDKCDKETPCKNYDCEDYCVADMRVARCGCRYGAVLKADNKTCDYSNVFYAAAGRYVTMFNAAHSSKHEVFVIAPSLVSAVSHNPQDKGFYFAYQDGYQYGLSYIGYRDMKGNMKMIIKKGHYGTIHTMSYDEEKEVIYFASSNGGMYTYYVGAQMAVNIRVASDTREIVLSQCARDLIFLDGSDGFGKVKRLRDNEGSTSKLITYGYKEIAGLALCYKTNSLYWFDSSSKTIQESRAEFTCQRTVSKISGDDVQSIVKKNNYIYYVKKGNESRNLYMLDVYSGEQSTLHLKVNPAIHRMKQIMQGREKMEGYKKGPDGQYYNYIAASMTFDMAVQKCKADKAYLVMYEHPEVHDFLVKEYKYFWIGAQDKSQEGMWMWMDGKRVRNSHWRYGEPAGRNLDDDCALMEDGKWRDACCQTYRAPAVCQRKEDPIKEPQHVYTACGGTVPSSVRTIRYPFSGDYMKNTTCTWIIQRKEPFTLNFTRMDLKETTNCNEDFVRINDGHKWCGKRMPLDTFSMNGRMKLMFNSDLGRGSGPDTGSGFEVKLTGSRCNGDRENCCTEMTPCGSGEGDCDSDDQCMGKMVCGTNNCLWGGNDDCCKGKDGEEKNDPTKRPYTTSMLPLTGRPDTTLDSNRSSENTTQSGHRRNRRDVQAAARGMMITERPSTGEKDECMDTSTAKGQCAQIKMNGGCVRHYNMMEMCRKTCGVCKDCYDHPSTMNQCELLKKYSGCNKNAVNHLLLSCRKTCDACHVCMDNPLASGDCPKWKADGLCTKMEHAANMRYMCTKTCGFCRDMPMPTKVPTTPMQHEGKCTRERAEAQTQYFTTYVPQCKPDGTFHDKQCWAATGYCWCVESKTGRELPGTRKGPGANVVCGYMKGLDGDHYKYVPEEKTWSEASQHCRAEGAMLARTYSQQMVDYLAKQYNQPFWLGANDIRQEGTWMWEEDHKIRTGFWGKSQPDHGDNEDCVVMHNNKWHDKPCETKFSFVCQKAASFEGNDRRVYTLLKSEEVDLDKAKQMCARINSHLAYIDNDITKEFVGRKMAELNPTPNPMKPWWIWLGGEDKHSNNMFTWFNGKNVDKMYWQAGEPNNFMGQQENCMWTIGVHPLHLYDAPCKSLAASSVLCQREVVMDDMVGYERARDGYYYKFYVNTPTTWRMAKSYCEIEGGRLAVVDNYETFAYIQTKVRGMPPNKYLWLGAHDENSNNQWKWLNGEKVVMDVNNKNNFWFPGEPNNWDGRQENCMITGSTAWEGRLADAVCEWSGPTAPGFVCQRAMTTKAPPMVTTRPRPHMPKIMEGYRQGPDGNYYKYYSMKQNWTEARSQCARDGGMLAINNNKAIHSYIMKSFPSNFWYGGQYQAMPQCFSMGNVRAGSCHVKRPFLCQMKGSFGRCGRGMKCPNPLLYPFGKQVGDHMVPKGDDTYGRLQFEKGFPFFSRLKKDIYINTNGYITADKPSNKWRNHDFDVSVTAAYMNDYSTEHGGDIFYRATNDESIMVRLAFEASLAKRQPGMEPIPKGYKPTLAIVVTWRDVRLKNDSRKMATFQEVIHTDFKIVVTTTVAIRFDGLGGVPGFSEPGCHNSFFNASTYRDTVELQKSSNIGIKGIYVNRVDVPKCAIPRMSHPMEIKWKPSHPSVETSQSFYFNGKDRITQVFTNSYSGPYVSLPFVTKITHSLDEVKVNYVTYTQAMKNFQYLSVGMLVIRDNLKETDQCHYGSLHLKTSTQTQCYQHHFNESMERSPNVILSAMIQQPQGPLDGLSNVWLRNVSMYGFEVCYKGMVSFWGPNSIYVDYLAITRTSEFIIEVGMKKLSKMDRRMEMKMNDAMYKDNKMQKEMAKKSMKDWQMEKENNTRDGYMSRDMKIFCEDVSFRYKYAVAPAVFVTPEVMDNSTEEVLAWLYTTTKNYVSICAKRSSDPTEYGRKSEMKVHYTVSGEMDACSKFRCRYSYQECHLDANKKPYCGCKKNCTEYPQMEFCANNFYTYKSKCEMEQHMCKMNYNETQIQKMKMAYPGKCKQFPYQAGKTQLEDVKEVDVAFCKYIKLDKSNFNDNGMDPVKVLLTVTWNQTELGDKLNEATASWSEEVTTSQFKACVLVAGRHFFADDRIKTPPSVQWVAFQDGVAGTDDNLDVGTVNMPTWFSGSRCSVIQMDKDFNDKSKILVSVEHSKKRSLENAMTAWVEMSADGNVTKICARELQNFDGVHEGIKIHYMVIHGHKAIRPYVTEAQHIYFERQKFSAGQSIAPVCKTVMFNYDFPMLPNPTVIITAVNTSRRVMGSPFSPHDIAVWLEGNNDTHLTACFKSLRAGLYREEVTLHYSIWPTLCNDGWRFHDGYCYSNNERNQSSTWDNANSSCVAQDSHLTKYDGGSRSKYYFMDKRFQYADDRAAWIMLSARNMCAATNFTSGEVNYQSCSNMHPYMCEQDADLLNRGCHCMNNGTCERVANDTGTYIYDQPPVCKCKRGFMGKRCEKRDPYKHTNCSNYQDRMSYHVGYIDSKVWYRFQGREMVEYCPIFSGCASIGGSLPEDGDLVQRHITYGNHAMSKWVRPRCERTGSVMIRNCGKFNIYKFHNIDMSVGARFCLQRNSNNMRDADGYNMTTAMPRMTTAMPRAMPTRKSNY